MRPLLPAVLSAALALTCVRDAAALEFRGVGTRVYDENELTSLGEYFDGQEDTGRRTYHRCDSSRRGGLYLIADLDSPLDSLAPDSVLLLEIVRADDGRQEQLRLPFAEAVGRMGTVLYVGLTDVDRCDLVLLAWRMSVCDASGKVLASTQSFLWEMP